MSEDCNIIKDYGLVAKHGDVELRLRLVSWYGNEAKIDLRGWINGFGKGGMVFTKEEFSNLKKLLNDNAELIEEYTAKVQTEEPKAEEKSEPKEEKPKAKRGRPPKAKVEESKEEVIKESKAEEKPVDDVRSDIIDALTTLKTSDPGYMKAIAKANPKELQLAIDIMNGKNKKPAEKAKAKTETKKGGRKAKEIKPKEKKAEVIQFPKPKPELEHKLVTEGNATYEECEAKINKEREMFKDSDSEYVFVGLLELAKVDADFRNNLMREDKSFTGAMEYMMNQVQAGYGYKKGQMGWCDKDLGLGFAIDYYNTDESAKTKGKAEKVETEEEGGEDEE